tara:strand:+ start:2175 stop:2678 length:504 start_codon:yes stop_codon:yes gene_type:complete
VTKDIIRYFLEIKSIKDLNSVELISPNYSINLLEPRDLQLNKFFYKIVGKKYSWTDRLAWSEVKWIDYISNEKLSTYVLRNENDIAGYFELIFHEDKKETEIAYFGILEEYFGKKLGGYLLSYAIKKSFSIGATRVWLHTCTLDHENALKNYLNRGMKIFKTETIFR